ncbi:MAG: hypothetical protein ACR2G3_02280 [Solirubrobacterales bacterium]
MDRARPARPPGQEAGAPPGPPGDWTRLLGEALGGGDPFEAMRGHLDDEGAGCVEWCPICRLADLWRASATPELREQWAAVQREALLTIRSLVDHYVERTKRGGGPPGPRVEDIPVE